MKRILLLLFSLITTAAIGQYPINQILSSDSTMVSVGRNATGGIRGGLVNMVFADTTAANLSRISYYTGAQIWTTTDSAIWVRFKGTPSFWVKMAGASGGTTGSFWNITGNYFGGGVPLNYGVGTNSYDYLPLKTNNITRLLIPPDGILRSSAPANKYLMMDTTTLEMYYGDGGGGSGWSLTGNSGTTSSNFIGTTDNQPLSFRVNNRWAGRIYTNGSVFIGDSSGVNNSALNNAGFGRYSLYNNTTGSYNTGSGAYSLYGNTTGWGNTGSGVYSLYSNTSGEGNTGMGYAAGYNAKQKVDAKNQILIGANTYGTRDSIAVIGASFMKETILRGKLIDSTLSAGSGTKAVRWNSSTGEFTYADTTVGGGGGGGLTIGTTTIANSATGSILYDSSGILSRNADLYWDVSNKRLGIGTSTPATKFHTVGTVRHQTLGTAITDTTTYKPLVINSSGDVLPSTYWYGGGGGGTPAGSNKQVQYNNSGSFGGAAGFEYQSGSSPNVTITGQNAAHVPLYVKGIGSTQTADLFRVMRYDDSAMFRIAANGSVTIGPAYDYVNAIHPPGHEFRYSNSGYTGGIKIRNHNSGSEVRLHTINNGLYITDNGGTAAPMTLGTRTNPADASTFIAALGVWTISAGRLGIGGTAHASAQLDASSTTKGFLPPRMTGTQAEAISSPAEGLMVYATDGSGSTITSKGWWGYDGSTWVKLN